MHSIVVRLHMSSASVYKYILHVCQLVCLFVFFYNESFVFLTRQAHTYIHHLDRRRPWYTHGTALDRVEKSRAVQNSGTTARLRPG